MKIFVPKDSRRKFFMACGQQDGIFSRYDSEAAAKRNGTQYYI